MKIATYNVNGIRAAVKKGLLNWIQTEQPDILMLQETKVQAGQIDHSLFEDLGYHTYWNYAEKKGYSGVATFARQKPLAISCEMGHSPYDDEGRTLLTVWKDFAVLNVYIPSGSSGEERHAFKMKFLEDFRHYIDNLLDQYPSLIIGGDFNIVHTRLDIHNPDRKDNPSGYRPEERAWLDRLCSRRFVDAYRHLHPQAVEFSWWTYRAGARAKNKGWRIDYLCLTPDLTSRIIDVRHANEAMQSDHCPVVMELK